MDGSLPGSTVHGIFQARILEWAAISFSRGSSQPRDRTPVCCIADRRFTVWATREAQGAVKCLTNNLPAHTYCWDHELSVYPRIRCRRQTGHCYQVPFVGVLDYLLWYHTLPHINCWVCTQYLTSAQLMTGVLTLFFTLTFMFLMSNIHFDYHSRFSISHLTISGETCILCS